MTTTFPSQKRQIVQVFTSSGTFLDCWRDAPLLAGFKEAVNSATTPLKVQLPRPWDNYDQPGVSGSRGTVLQGNVVKYYLFGDALPATGLLRFQGFIDSIDPQISESGEESVTVTIVPFSSSLGDHGVATSVSFGIANNSATYIDPIIMFNYWFLTADVYATFASPLTLDPANPTSSGRLLQYTFQSQTLLSIFQTILLMLPANWFFRCNADNSVTLNVAAATAQHQFIVGQHVVNPQYSLDYQQLRNDIYVTGSTPATIYARATGSDLSTIGQRLYTNSDNRIADSNTCTVIAQGLLNLYDRPLVRTKFRVPDYRGGSFPTLGYDIETLKVGDTLQLIDPSSSAINTSLWDNAHWGSSYWGGSYGALDTIAQIVSISYNWDYVDLEIGAIQPSQSAALLNLQRAFQDYTII